MSDTAILVEEIHATIRALKQAIRDAALERAAQVAEEYDGRGIDEDHAALTCDEIAAAIRALKQPAESSAA
jgi:4-hydroxyphenylpyruvate dioxygenase-like putative hemolysin